ncbi:MAG: peptide-binding protein [Thermodesulfovibrionales bacterium]|nr:peptide-binding protein [Thermodesulfovibrionales bacterium]
MLCSDKGAWQAVRAEQSLKRKTFYYLLLLFFCSALTGCRIEHEIRERESIRVGTLADARMLLPLFASDSASAEISSLIFNGLTKYNKNIKLVGDLAESWQIKNNGREIIFHLRRNVKWHDGREFTSRDVLFTYRAVTDPKNPTPYGGIYGPVDRVEAIDKYTVRVIYKEPFAPALESWSMGILPAHLLEGKDLAKSELNRAPVGTGPYRFKRWITGQRIELERFDDYFEGRPNIKKYIARIIPDMSTMFLELKFGGIDYMGLTPAQYKLKADTEYFKKRFQKFRYPAFGYTYLGFNLLDERFKEKRVRQAIAYAIDKDKIIRGVLLGYGRPCTGPFPPDSWAYNKKIKGYPYDPAKALELLMEAGWKRGDDGILRKNGVPFKFTVLVNQGNTQRLMAAQIIKEDLKKIGIEMDIRVLEWQTLLHQFIDKRAFEAVIMGWALSRDPDIYDIWHSSKTREGEFNFISYRNPEVDSLLLKGRTTLNIEERKKIYWRIHEILHEDQPTVFLYVPDALPVIHKRFKGIEPSPIGIWHNFIHWYVE